MKKVNENKGITLIALVITIIVMLILVGVTIKIGANGGLFDSAKKAKNEALFKAEQESLQNLVFGRYNVQDEIVDLESLQQDLENAQGDWKDVKISKTEETPELLTVIGVKSERIHSVAKDGTISEVEVGKATITVKIEGEGAVQYKIEDGTSQEVTEEGIKCKTNTIVTLTTTSKIKNVNGTDIQYEFDGWYLDGVLKSGDLSYEITVTEDTTYTARFVPQSTLIYYLDSNNQEQVEITTNKTLTGYKNRTDITKIEIGNCCEAISNSAFEGCTGISELLSNVKNTLKISYSAFVGCTGLTKINLPNVDFDQGGSWSGAQFINCGKLTEAILGSKEHPLTKAAVPTRIFYQNIQNDLTIKVYVDDGNTTLYNMNYWGGTNATIEFYNTQNELVNVIMGCNYQGNAEINWAELPNADKITYIIPNAFKGCTNLALESLPANLTYIGESAFDGCSNLKISQIPEKCATIEKYAFQKCTSIKEINGLSQIQVSLMDGAFLGCTNLEKVNISNVSFVTNGNGTQFAYCTGLKNITLGSIGNPISNISSATFYSCNQIIIKVYIQNGTTNLAKEPWKANNATLEYYNASTGEKI